MYDFAPEERETSRHRLDGSDVDWGQGVRPQTEPTGQVEVSTGRGGTQSEEDSTCRCTDLRVIY